MGNVTDLPLRGHCNTNADLAAHLRDLAQHIEGLTNAPLQNIVIISLFCDGDVDSTVIGQPIDTLSMAGLFALLGRAV